MTAATVWRDRALMSRASELKARNAANRPVTETPGDTWAGEYARALRDIRHAEADVHALYARQYEAAFASAAMHEMAEQVSA